MTRPPLSSGRFLATAKRLKSLGASVFPGSGIAWVTAWSDPTGAFTTLTPAFVS